MIETKCFDSKKGGNMCKIAAKLFALANSLNKNVNKRRRRLQKKIKESNILLLHMLKKQNKRKRCLQKLLMQIVAPTQIAKNVPIKGSCKRFERNTVCKQFAIQTMMKGLEKTFILLEAHFFILMKRCNIC